MVEIIAKKTDYYEDPVKEEVYTSIAPDVLQSDLTGDKEQLILYLNKNAGTFYSAKTLAEECGYEEGGTQVQLRKAITELIQTGCPIVSSSKGFSWATNSAMITHYITKLRSRVMGIEHRINDLVIIQRQLEEQGK